MSSLFDITKSAFSFISQVCSGTRPRAVEQSPVLFTPDEINTLPVDVSDAVEGAEFGIGDFLGELDFE
ncbi:MAG: hypothetical protein Q7U57_00070 [Methylovulum sp.]|nr:hypothetical protein [Methylovulum sp.]